MVDGESSVTIRSCGDVNSRGVDDGASVPLVHPRLHGDDVVPQHHQS
jgi:hypothetical protein